MGGDGRSGTSAPAGKPSGPGHVHLALALPLWIAVAVFIVTFGADWLARTLLNRPLDPSQADQLRRVGGLMLAIGTALTAVGTLARLFSSQPGAVHSRTPLALWPGLPLALLVLVLAAAVLLARLPWAFLVVQLNNAFDEYALAAPVLAIAVAAVVCRESRPGATAMLAAPIVVLAVSSLALQQSISRSAYSAIITALVLALGTGVVALVARAPLLGYLAGGLLAAGLSGLVLAIGLHTPSELFAVLALMSLPPFLLYLLVTEGLTGLSRTLVAGAAEIAAIVVMLIGVQIAAVAMISLGYKPGLAERAPELLAAGSLLIVASLTLLGALIGVLVTPLLAVVAIALLPVPTLMPLVLAGSVIALVLRSIRTGSGTILWGPAGSAIDRVPALAVVAVALVAMVVGVLVPLPQLF